MKDSKYVKCSTYWSYAWQVHSPPSSITIACGITACFKLPIICQFWTIAPQHMRLACNWFEGQIWFWKVKKLKIFYYIDINLLQSGTNPVHFESEHFLFASPTIKNPFLQWYWTSSCDKKLVSMYNLIVLIFSSSFKWNFCIRTK